MPDGEGSTLAFTSGEMQRLEFTQDMSGTHVEEMSDLEVSIWVQNYGSKYVYNSHFAYEYTDIHPYPVENLTLTEVAGPRGLGCPGQWKPHRLQCLCQQRTDGRKHHRNRVFV